MVGRPTAAGKVTVDDQTGERDETDRTLDVTTPGSATPGRASGAAAGAAAGGAAAVDPAPDQAPDQAPDPARDQRPADVSASEHSVPSSQVLEPLPVQPRRSPAIWAVVVALLGVLVLVVTVGAHAGALALSGVLAVAGVCRAVTPGAVVGLAVRSRTFDVTFYLLLAAAVAVLTQTTPDI